MLLRNCFLMVLVHLITISYGNCQSKFDPAKESLKLFDRYKPVIEKKNEGILDDPLIITGDLNGDGLPDCILSFVMTPKEGGNAIIGHECVVYLNTGTGMKAAGAFPEFKFCYTPDHIKNGIIYIKQYECAPPYNTFLKDSKLAYRNGKIVEMK